MNADARQVAELVPMAELLRALGFAVSERTHRAPCVLHEGANPSAFSWREDGLWRCHACGRGGDRIALVREARSCSFGEAVSLLAQLAGVSDSPERRSPEEVARAGQRRERAGAAAWRIRDEVVRLRIFYGHALHRSERLWRRMGDELLCARTEGEREAVWKHMARLAPACTFFLAAFYYLNGADGVTLTRFALASPAERRALILGEAQNADGALQAA